MMKEIIYTLILCCPLVANAGVLKSDLSLLKGDLSQQPEDPTDPYWNLAWHGRLASYGDPDSQFFVAQIYEQGNLVPKDLSKAIDFYKQAAYQGHLESCRKLAELLPEEAEDWFTVAAKLNDPMAQIKLSKLYESRGDREKAIFWLEKAMRILFPETDDLTTVSPDLERLKGTS